MPDNFKLTQAQLQGRTGKQEVAFTQAKAGDPVIVTVPDGYQLYGSNSVFGNGINSLLLTGQYEMDAPSTAIQVSSKGGSFDYTINGQTGSVYIPTYTQTIEPNEEQQYVGNDFRASSSQFPQYLHNLQKNAKLLFNNAFEAEMSSDNNNLDHLSSYHDLTFTTLLSDGQNVSQITGFDPSLVGATVHLSFQDGSTQDLTVGPDGSVTLDTDKNLKSIEFTLAGQLTQTFDNSLKIYGKVSEKYQNGAAVKDGDVLSNKMTVTMANKTILSRTDKANVYKSDM